MTEAEWQQSTVVYDMLRALRARKSLWQWTTRKARLFACACCRRAWHVLTEPAQRKAVEMAEQAAAKHIRLPDLWQVHQATDPIQLGAAPSSSLGGWSRGSKADWDFSLEFSPQPDPPQRAMLCNPGRWAATPRPWGEPYFTANDVRGLLYFRVGVDVAKVEQAAQCDLLRDIVGPPRPLHAVDQAWLVQKDGAIPKLARSIYEERAFDQLPLLADTLAEVGCTDAVLLDHGRRAGEHVRGCWLVDLLCGME